MHDDKVLVFIKQTAIEVLDARKIVLFGSRARGDNLERSDYDFAVEPALSKVRFWSRFKAIVDEDAPTLLHIDLVNLASIVDPVLLSAIEREGRILYVVQPNKKVDQ